MMLKEKPDNKLLWHLLFIFIFLIVPILVSTRPSGEPFLTVTRPFTRDIIGNVLLLSFFYLNYYVLVPKYYFNKKYVAYIVIILLSLTIILMLPSLIAERLFLTGSGSPPSFKPKRIEDTVRERGVIALFFSRLRHFLYLFFIALFFSFLLRIRENMAKIREEKLKAELSSLKSQINPHFLFNTLNSIYALSIKKDDRASEAITNLSGLMRYIIKDADKYKIPLNTELEYIKNYIELQKARLGDTVTVYFDCTGETRNKEIAPLILITYIENAFKYGVSPDEDDCIIKISIRIQDERISLHILNRKVARSARLESTGMGMKNTEKRLDHLYPQKHTLLINDGNENYSVTLSIELT